MHIIILLISILFLTIVTVYSLLLPPKCFQSILIARDNCNISIIPGAFPSINLPETLFGQKCCNKTGCFDNFPGSTHECFPTLPDCPAEMGIEFKVYTSETPQGQSIDYENLNTSIQNLILDPKRPFVVATHGLGSDWPKWWFRPMVDSFLKMKNNLLFVRWSKGAHDTVSLISYFKAVANSRAVARSASIVLKNMLNAQKVDLAQTTFVGYSLGAHIVGMIGSEISGVPRIFALDPAGPMYTCQDGSVRLDQTDAKLVVVLHTNGDSYFFGGLGTPQAMGHIDLYANDGAIQPGCQRGHAKSMQDVMANKGIKATGGANDPQWCSHKRAMQIFLEMLNNESASKCTFLAFPCENSQNWANGKCFPCNPKTGCPFVGYNNLLPNTTIRGKFYFGTLPDTSNGGTYCANHHLVSITPDSNVAGRIDLTLLVPRDYTQDMIFLNHDENHLIANKPNQKILQSWYQIDAVLIIRLKFQSSNNQKSSWVIKDCSSTNMNNITFHCSEKVTVTDGAVVELRLIKK